MRTELAQMAHVLNYLGIPRRVTRDETPCVDFIWCHNDERLTCSVA